MNNRTEITPFIATGLLAAAICFSVLSSVVIGCYMPQLMMPIVLSCLCSFMFGMTNYFWSCYRQTLRRHKAGYTTGNQLTVDRLLFSGMFTLNIVSLYFLLDFFNTLLGFT